MKPVRVALLCLAAPALVAVSLRAAARPEPVITPIPTEITSAGPAEMVSTATESIFTFQDQVVVVGTNLRLTCDRLVVVAKRTGDPKATLGKQQNFKSLVATGHVRLVQAEREALCDRAEVLPGEDKVILTGNPATVRSVDGVYAGSGPKMTLLRGQQRAVIEAPRFVLPALDDIGPGNKKPKTVAPAADATTPPPITVPIPPVSVPPK
eukprot:TRINITY_DN20684_c0_g2_i1.p1 TRINITY_DN20684_c0_g2~~TRINITY_DN20684_c0_g2_i1.p1  ORF type:complete len:235 (+),score=23.88 TRINITY_DN20684_c0_g2_i1:79-705(+)